MQMNPTDLAHRAADLGHAASSLATQVVDTISEHGAAALDTAGRVAGDVGDVIVDAVDRVGRALPSTRDRRRLPVMPLTLAAIGLAVVMVVRRRKRNAPRAATAAKAGGAHRVDDASANGSARVRAAEERAAGLA